METVRAIRTLSPADKLPEYYLQCRHEVDVAAQRGCSAWVCPTLGRINHTLAWDERGEVRFFVLEEDELACNNHVNNYARELLRVFQRFVPHARMGEPRESGHVSFTVEVPLSAEAGAPIAYFTIAPTHAYLYGTNGVENRHLWQWLALNWREEVRWVGSLPVFVELYDDGVLYGPKKVWDPLAMLCTLLTQHRQHCGGK